MVRERYPGFELKLSKGLLNWEAVAKEIPAPLVAVPLQFQVEYPAAFPVAPIRVFPISPELPAEDLGHAWHRWADGRICIVKPSQWLLSYTARDVIDKVIDWYFNYLAYKNELIDKMPDVGRADLSRK